AAADAGARRLLDGAAGVRRPAALARPRRAPGHGRARALAGVPPVARAPARGAGAGAGGATMTGQRQDERPAAGWWDAGSVAAVAVGSIAVSLCIGPGRAPHPQLGPAAQAQADAFPRPRLQADPRADLHELQQQRSGLLDQWAWLDRRQGLCVVPVPVAVD